MKKFTRFFVGLLALVIIIVLVLAHIQPQDVTITRTIAIRAPKEAVFAQMVYFKNWPNWSPWYQIDPTMKMTYTGADGTPGSGYQWAGTDKTGAGSMVNTAVSGTQMDFNIFITKPQETTIKAMLKAADSLGYIKATWSFTMHFSYPWNAMNQFMNIDKLMGHDLEAGLANMKQYVESHEVAAVK